MELNLSSEDAAFRGEVRALPAAQRISRGGPTRLHKCTAQRHASVLKRRPHRSILQARKADEFALVQCLQRGVDQFIRGHEEFVGEWRRSKTGRLKKFRANRTGK